jgi:hypothetical protein
VAFKELTTATVFLTELTHFSCTALVLVEVKGEVVCLDLKPTENTATHSFHCTGTKTAPAEEWCKGGDVAEACVEPTVPSLLESVNHGTFKTAIQLALGNTTFGVAIAGMV